MNDATFPTPAEAWHRLREGNARFAAGAMAHPGQGADRRAEVAAAQHPHTVVLGCSDSRVAAELLFDQGLGDLFVVRTAGHVLDPAVLGSVEYGVAVLGAPLVVVLGHDSCGALAAAVETRATGATPAGHIGAVVERVLPSLGTDQADPAELRDRHVRATVTALLAESPVLAAAVDRGELAVLGLSYALAEGTVAVVGRAGPV